MPARIARLDNERATLGDVSWAQEAPHDLFHADGVGTPEADLAGLLAKTGAPEQDLQTPDLRCGAPADFVAPAQQLLPGRQLLIVPTMVTFLQALGLGGCSSAARRRRATVRPMHRAEFTFASFWFLFSHRTGGGEANA